MSDTPTTDAQALCIWGPETRSPSGAYVSADFARTLERELAKAQAHLDRLTGMKFSDRMHAALVARAEEAERELAAAVLAERIRVARECERLACIACGQHIGIRAAFPEAFK